MATEKERRQQVLTEADLEAIRESIRCEKCVFSHDVADTLNGLARNINTATKLSTRIIITGIVAGVLSGIWFAVKHVLLDALASGKLPK